MITRTHCVRYRLNEHQTPQCRIAPYPKGLSRRFGIDYSLRQCCRTSGFVTTLCCHSQTCWVLRS